MAVNKIENVLSAVHVSFNVNGWSKKRVLKLEKELSELLPYIKVINGDSNVLLFGGRGSYLWTPRHEPYVHLTRQGNILSAKIVCEDLGGKIYDNNDASQREMNSLSKNVAETINRLLRQKFVNIKEVDVRYDNFYRRPPSPRTWSQAAGGRMGKRNSGNSSFSFHS